MFKSIQKIFALAALILLLPFASAIAGELTILGAPDPDSRIIAGDTLASEPRANWGFRSIRADRAYLLGFHGQGIKVAILDTGIDAAHPDLIGAYAGGYDFLEMDEIPQDDNGHGTHVAGIIAAAANQWGIVGIAPGAQLYALKVCDSRGRCSPGAIIQALDWAISHGMQVANSSFGGRADEGLRQAYQRAWEAGIFLTAAAGNDGPASECPTDNRRFPASFPMVLGVGAMEQAGRIAPYSSMPPDVVAPGSGILSTIPGGDFESWSGTSMAAPHVAGLAALILGRGMRDVNGDGRVNDELSTRIRLWTRKSGAGRCGRARWGWGLIDAAETLR